MPVAARRAKSGFSLTPCTTSIGSAVSASAIKNTPAAQAICEGVFASTTSDRTSRRHLTSRGAWYSTLRSNARKRRKISSDISRPDRGKHSPESDFGQTPSDSARRLPIPNATFQASREAIEAFRNRSWGQLRLKSPRLVIGIRLPNLTIPSRKPE